MKKRGKSGKPPSKGFRACCLECDWCQSAPLILKDVDCVCVKLAKPLSQKKLWGKPCRHFAALSLNVS